MYARVLSALRGKAVLFLCGLRVLRGEAFLCLRVPGVPGGEAFQQQIGATVRRERNRDRSSQTGERAMSAVYRFGNGSAVRHLYSSPVIVTLISSLL